MCRSPPSPLEGGAEGTTSDPPSGEEDKKQDPDPESYCNFEFPVYR